MLVLRVLLCWVRLVGAGGSRRRGPGGGGAGRRWLGRSDDLVTSIKTPGDAVELDVQSLDLALVVQLEQIEALDRVVSVADAGEGPLPDDRVAVDGGDEESLDAGSGGVVEQAVDVFCLAW